MVTAYYDLPSSHGRRRINVAAMCGYMICATLLAVCICFTSEAISPGSGLLTRILIGNAVANENAAFGHMFHGSKQIDFRLDGKTAHYLDPGRQMTEGEQQYVFRFAAHRGLPLYYLGGQFLLDP